jgi:hypothetical protein
LESDIAGRSPAELKKFYCLPDVPTHYVEVQVLAGTKVRKGIAGAQPNWGSPTNGGIQYEFADFDPQTTNAIFTEIGLIPWH